MSISKSILAAALSMAVSASQAYVVTSSERHGGDQSFDSESQGRHGGDDDVRLPHGDDRFHDEPGHHAPYGGMLPAVPEPETVVLLVAGLGAVCWVARRRSDRDA